jgi:hypothetical protein
MEKFMKIRILAALIVASAIAAPAVGRTIDLYVAPGVRND